MIDRPMRLAVRLTLNIRKRLLVENDSLWILHHREGASAGASGHDLVVGLRRRGGVDLQQWLLEACAGQAQNVGGAQRDEEHHAENDDRREHRHNERLHLLRSDVAPELQRRERRVAEVLRQKREARLAHAVQGAVVLGANASAALAVRVAPGFATEGFAGAARGLRAPAVADAVFRARVRLADALAPHAFRHATLAGAAQHRARARGRLGAFALLAADAREGAVARLALAVGVVALRLAAPSPAPEYPAAAPRVPVADHRGRRGWRRRGRRGRRGGS